MIAVRMMQMTVDDVIGVVAMWYGGVTAVRGVDVPGGLFGRAMTGGALCGICGADGDGVFVRVRTMRMMQMAAIEVVGVTLMLNGEMATARAVLMRVGVLGVCGTTASDERERNDEA